MKTKVILFLFALLMAGNQSYLSATEMKVGVIDLQFAINNSAEGKRVLANIRKKLQREAGILKRKESELKRLQEEIQTQGYLLSADVRAKKEETLRRRATEFKRYREDKSSEFNENKNKATGKIYTGLMDIVYEYAKKEGYTLIIEGGVKQGGVPNTLVYFDQKVNITKTIVSLYDAKMAKKK